VTIYTGSRGRERLSKERERERERERKGKWWKVYYSGKGEVKLILHMDD